MTHTRGKTDFSEGPSVHGGLLQLRDKVPKKSTEHETAAS